MQNQLFITNLFKKILSLVSLAGILSSAFSVAAQTKRGVQTTKTSAVKPTTKQTGGNQNSSCSGGWSGIVTYKKTLNYTRDSGKTKRIPHGTNHSIISDDYKYTGRIVVDGSQGANVLTANGQVSANDVRKSWKRVEQNDTCFYEGIKGSVLQWGETDESDITNAFGEGETQFSMNVNELGGTYRFSFRLPDAPGVNDRVNNRTSGGWCNPKSNEPSNRTEKYPIKVDGLGEEIGDLKIDPARPDVLSGSKTWEEGSMASTKYVHTVTWSFKRCPAPIEVTDIRFDEHPYPDFKTWKEIEATRGTIDGNIVRIRATITNFSGETRFPNIKFNELVENWTLPEGETSIRLEAGESREIELVWDTAGYAWRGKGYDAESYRKIKVEAEESGRTSQLTKLIVVNPRPVVLAHGLWSNAAAWAGYDKFFEEGHSKLWKSYAVGANPSVAKMNTGESFGNTAQTNRISQNAEELDKQVEFVRKEKNAWHVDIVAHSMGGLIARYYIANDMPLNPLRLKPVVTKLIMLGTPNAGSPCAELMYRALSASGNKVRALWDLIPSVVVRFNDSTSKRRGVRFSALVGWRIPTTCQSPSSGDGVVTIGSARFKIMDWRYSNSLAHTDLTSRADFGSFVFPRLSTGPRGNHDPELVAEAPATQNDNYAADSIAPPADRYGFNRMFRKASYKTEIVQNDDEAMGDIQIEGLTLTKQIKLAAGQTTEIEIPMTSGSRASIVFAAAPNVSATLIDASGAIVGKNSAGSAESRQMFRTIAVDKSIAAGTWKLKLESKEAADANVILAAFTDPNPLVLELTTGKPTATKQIPLQAKLTRDGSPVSGAAIKAKVQSENGKTLELTLLDDGANGDGAAGDGIYAATTEKLADGDYLIEAAAETNGQTRFAAATLSVGAPSSVAPAKKAAGKTIKK
jgi:pimeloyl-ACP methyl ester carboxylesterase